MRQGPLRLLGVVLALSVASPLGAGAQEEGEPDDLPAVIEAPRQVTAGQNPVRSFVAPALAVHPDDPSTVVMAVGDALNGGCGLQVSRDGGLSWVTTAPTLLPNDLPMCVQRNFGPVMTPAFASDGTLYVNVSGSARGAGTPNGPITALVARTTDLGVTHDTATVARPENFVFTPPAGGEPRTGYYQWRIPTLAVDPTNPRKVYAGWRLWNDGITGVSFRAFPQRSYISVSDDGGRTWTPPVDVMKETIDESRARELNMIFSGENVTQADTPQLVVDGEGTVYGFTKEQPPQAPQGQPVPKSRLLMFKSTDRGRTWATTVISEGAQRIDLPSAAVDRRNGNLYLVYGSRGAATPTGQPASPSELYFTASTDGGQTWSQPRNITDDETSRGANQYFPGISVSPNGRIDIAWYDYRNDPFFRPGEVGNMDAAVGERYWDVYYTYSQDAGATWSDNMRVTNPSVDGDVGVTFANSDVRGPIGIASIDEAAYIAWPDSRPTSTSDVQAEDAYFSRVRFDEVRPLGSRGSDGTPGWQWAIAGAGVALALGGLALAAGVRGAPGGGGGADAGRSQQAA